MGWKTVGQSTSIERVSRAIHQKRLSHAYLICGVDGVGKLTFALDIAKVANCLNVDRDFVLESKHIITQTFTFMMSIEILGVRIMLQQWFLLNNYEKIF